MRIAFVTSVISKRLGGIQNTGYYFAQCFPKKSDFEAFCAVDSETEGLTCRIHKSRYKSNDTINYHLSIIKMLFAANKENRIDFTFAAFYPMALSCMLLKKIRGVPYGVMMHGNELLDGVEPQNGIKKILRKVRFVIRKKILENADILFANSEYTKSLCENKFRSKKIEIIHPPICFEKHYIEQTNKTYRVFSLGRLEKRKGFQYVVEAMKSLVEDIPQLQYLIAGGGDYSGELTALIETMGLQKNVKLLGRISEEQKDALYKECDFFIMPSFKVDEESSVEGFGIVFIEANMYGKYVLATRSGGIPDAIIDGVTGEFVEEKNADSIAKVLSRLYKDNFSYDPYKCVEWSKEMDINAISDQYIDAISTTISK